MSLRITCPECKTVCKIDDNLRGKKVRCRECDRLLPVPASEPAIVDMELAEGFHEPKGKSAPRPGPKRGQRDDDDRPDSRSDRDGSSPRQAQKKGKSGLLPVLLIGCGSLAVLGVVGIGAVVVAFFVFRAAPVPADDPAPIVQGQPVPVFKDDFNNNGGPGPAFFQPPLPEKLGDAAMQRVKRSTVYVDVTMPGGQKASGSGFFAIEPGVVITNAHVLGMLQAQSQPPTNVHVIVNSGEPGEKTIRGTVAGVDRDTDLAVLRVAGDDLPPPLLVGTAQSLKELQKVHYFGFPFGKQLGANITVGNAAVSSLRKNPFGAIYEIQLDGNMQPGNSGGPLVDTSGRVVGVAVAIIKNTGTNFAIPADFVKLALDGRIAESTYGEPFLDNNQATLPVHYEFLDPLGRVRSLHVDVWVGDKGPERPFTSEAPPPVPGDGPHRTVDLAYQNGKAVGNIPLPAPEPGKVYWVQPKLINGTGRAQWQSAVALAPAVPLERVAVNLQMKLGEPGQRTLKLKSEMRLSVHEGKNILSKALKLDAQVLETLSPTDKGTKIVLTIGPNAFADEADGKLQPFSPKLTKRMRDLSPSFVSDPTGKLLTYSYPGINEKLADFEDLQFMFGRICNTFEETCLGMPNRTVNPLETWSARVPKLMPSKLKNKKRLVDLNLTCTYQGFRTNNDRREAFISLAGSVKGREKTDVEPIGKVSGRALLDLDRGYISQINLAISSEMDFEGVRVALTEDIDVGRSPGNPLNITAIAKKEPDPKPKTDPPVTKKDPPPDLKPKTDPLPKPDPMPAGPKVILDKDDHVAASDLYGPKARKCKIYEVKLEAGKLYVIEMKKVGTSAFNPFLVLQDANGKMLAQDDDSGENKNAKITFRAKESGTYKVVATSAIGPQAGAYHLSVTAVPAEKKE